MRVAWPADDRIGIVLRTLREEAGMTQQQLGAKIGCTRSHICKVESGAQLCSVGEFMAWCEALAARPSDAISVLAAREC